MRAVGAMVFEGDAWPTADGAAHHGLLDLEDRVPRGFSELLRFAGKASC